jgi:hypothetical protein
MSATHPVIPPYVDSRRPKIETHVLATRAQHVGLITDCWRKTVEGIFATGRALIAAKADLPHGEFLKMIDNDLPFGGSMAEKLMAIARNQVLSNPEHIPSLPASWSILYALSLVGDSMLRAAIESGVVHPAMGVREAVRLRPRKKTTTVHGRLLAGPQDAARDIAYQVEHITAKVDRQLPENLRGGIVDLFDRYRKGAVCDEAVFEALGVSIKRLCTHAEELRDGHAAAVETREKEQTEFPPVSEEAAATED